MWFVLQAFYSAGYGTSGAGTVAYLAHVIGFATGLLLALPLRGGTPPAAPAPDVRPRVSPPPGFR
jgi:membrane associated rhomboid family serine protease